MHTQGIGRRRGAGALLIGLAASAFALGGCASGFTNVAPAVAASAQRLGPAKGSACGSMLAVATAYYFIPAGTNTRVERAYQAALASVPGATQLVDVTVQENWTWWVLGTMRCITISGEAVK